MLGKPPLLYGLCLHRNRLHASLYAFLLEFPTRFCHRLYAETPSPRLELTMSLTLDTASYNTLGTVALEMQSTIFTYRFARNLLQLVTCSLIGRFVLSNESPYKAKATLGPHKASAHKPHSSYSKASGSYLSSYTFARPALAPPLSRQTILQAS